MNFVGFVYDSSILLFNSFRSETLTCAYAAGSPPLWEITENSLYVTTENDRVWCRVKETHVHLSEA